MNLHPFIRFAPSFGYLLMAAAWFSMIQVSLFPTQTFAWQLTQFFNRIMRDAIYFWDGLLGLSVLGNFALFISLFAISIFAMVKNLYMFRFILSHMGAIIFFFPLFVPSHSAASTTAGLPWMHIEVRSGASMLCMILFGLIVVACINEHVLHVRRIKRLILKAA